MLRCCRCLLSRIRLHFPAHGGFLKTLEPVIIILLICAESVCALPSEKKKLRDTPSQNLIVSNSTATDTSGRDAEREEEAMAANILTDCLRAGCRADFIKWADFSQIEDATARPDAYYESLCSVILSSFSEDLSLYLPLIQWALPIAKQVHHEKEWQLCI